jgi:hypothetical protein
MVRIVIRRRHNTTMISFLGLLLLGCLQREGFALPLQVTVNQKAAECVYDKLEAG